jgi:hypothetical protein
MSPYKDVEGENKERLKAEEDYRRYCFRFFT